jgi:putative ABC transport system substrate-binding protein
MYPDNTDLGRELAVSALEMLAAGGRDVSGMAPLREAQLAVNLRTAKHLGVDPGSAQGVDLTYPER